VNGGVVSTHTEHSFRCRVISEDSKAQKRVTYTGNNIQTMQHGFQTENLILEKIVETSTIENEIIIPLLLRNWI
jgi:hypothetical protein